MKILAADGALPALGRLCTLLQEALPGSEIAAFSRAADAEEYARAHPWDAAFVSGRLHVPGGTPLTHRLRQLAPQRPIIALIRSGEEPPGGETDRIAHPVSAQALVPVLAQLRQPAAPVPPVLLQVRCFGPFDVSTPEGTPLLFRRAKSRECLAYLISRCGARCTPAELAGILFPDLPADRRAPAVQAALTSLLRSLDEAGAREAVDRNSAGAAVCPERLICDFYQLRRGDPQAAAAFDGTFLAPYPWGTFVAGYLRQKYPPRCPGSPEAGQGPLP